MKKGQKIGVNSHIGKSGEKYISYMKSKKIYKIQISTHDKKKPQIDMGYAKNLDDAINMRDKYLNS